MDSQSDIAKQTLLRKIKMLKLISDEGTHASEERKATGLGTVG